MQAGMKKIKESRNKAASPNIDLEAGVRFTNSIHPNVPQVVITHSSQQNIANSTAQSTNCSNSLHPNNHKLSVESILKKRFITGRNLSTQSC